MTDVYIGHRAPAAHDGHRSASDRLMLGGVAVGAGIGTTALVRATSRRAVAGKVPESGPVAAGARMLVNSGVAHRIAGTGGASRIGSWAMQGAMTLGVLAAVWYGGPLIGGIGLPDPDHSPEDTELFNRALARLAESEAGAGYVEYLDERRDRIEILNDEEYEDALPALSGGAYLPRSRHLYVRQRLMRDEDDAALLLLHEGQHMRSWGNPLRFFGSMATGFARGVADGVAAGVRGENPISGAVEGIRQHFWLPNEVDSYSLEAQAAAELGIRTFSLPLQNPDGSARSREEIREVVSNHRAYQWNGMQRTVIGGGLGLGTAMAAGSAIRFAAGKVAPGSLLGRSWLASTALAAIPVTAAVVADRRAHT